MPFTQWENPYFTVDPPKQGDTFTIYQLKDGPETRNYRYEAYESLQEAGLAVDRQNYDLVYTAPLDKKTTLEDTLTVPPTSPATVFPFPTLWC